MMRLFTLTIILFACGCFTPTLKSRGNVTASGSGSSSVSPFTFSPMSGSVGTTVTVTGMDFSTVSSVSLGGVPAVITNQTNSSLQFIVMPGSTYSRLTITTPSALYSSSDYFTVTAPALPLNQQGAKLIGSGYISTPYESTVALSADGNTLAIGGSGDNASQGAFWVFTKSGGVWTQQGGKMISTGNTGPLGKEMAYLSVPMAILCSLVETETMVEWAPFGFGPDQTEYGLSKLDLSLERV